MLRAEAGANHAGRDWQELRGEFRLPLLLQGVALHAQRVKSRPILPLRA